MNKIIATLAFLGACSAILIAFPAPVSFAAPPAASHPLKVVGMAKFVLKATVKSVTADTLTAHVTNTSKNAGLFDNKDEGMRVSSKTTITKGGKNISLKQIKPGDKVKVFGIFNTKTGAITVVRWVKVVQK